MAEKLKYYTVILDGIDKSGKDTIAKYIWRFDKRLNVFVRGWPSLVVYAKKFSRDCIYELPYNKALYVHCLVKKDDWKIRCEIENEDISKIFYEEDSRMFKDAFIKLQQNGYKVLSVNTSSMTPYSIAKIIVDTIKKLNEENEDE